MVASGRGGLRLIILGAALAWGAAPAFAQGVDVAGAAARQAALVQFFSGGAPLSVQERAAIDASVAQAFASDPQGAQAAAVEAGKLTQMVQGWKGAKLVQGRELGRRAIAFEGLQALGRGPEAATAAQIVAARDPVVVADPAHKVLLTMQTVRALVAANRTGAQIFGTPAPGADAAPLLAATLQREWPGVDAGMRQALANAERNLPDAAAYLDHAPAAARARFIAAYRAKIMATPDPGGQQLRLAEIMAFTGETGARQGGGEAPGTMMRAQMHQRAMDAAGRSLMMSCGAPAGATQSPQRFAFCHP